jgi:hypothetical protein
MAKLRHDEESQGGDWRDTDSHFVVLMKSTIYLGVVAAKRLSPVLSARSTPLLVTLSCPMESAIIE